MPRSSPLLLALVALGLFGCAHEPPQVVRPAVIPWPHEQSDLKPDATVTWGRLENGLRYAILPHGVPRQRISVTLLVEVGSYHERNNELGYAHYVEHMAFRELQGFSRETIDQLLQRLGVAFGVHANAATTYFETRYYFNNLPSDEPTALPTALTLLRGVADGVAFEAESVQRERGVIFSEGLSRNAALLNARSDELEFLPPRAESIRWLDFSTTFPRSRLLARSPLGEERTLKAATPATLRAFYERWYRPERIVLAIAGDVSATEAAELVRQTFGSFAGRGPAPADLVIEPPRAARGSASVLTSIEGREAEPNVHITLGTARRETKGDTVERRREAMVRRAAFSMLSRRLEALTETGNAPFVSADITTLHRTPGYEMLLVRGVSPIPQWQEGMATLDQEVRRAAELGFTAPELERFLLRAKARLAHSRSMPQPPAADLAAALAFSAVHGVVFTSIAEDRVFEAEQLPTLTLEECNAALKALLPPGRLFAGASGPIGPEKKNWQPAGKALAENAKKALEPYPAPAPVKPFPYTDFGPAGTIVQQTHAEKLEAELIEFANGVRLTVKRTDFEPGHVRAIVRFGNGVATEPTEQPGLTWRGFHLLLGGLQGLTPDEQRASLSELSGGLGMTVNTDGFTLTMEGEAESLPLMLQATTAYFVHPAFRESDWNRSLGIARGLLAPYESTASGIAVYTLNYRTSANHPRFRRPQLAEVAERKPEELKAWLLPQLRSSPLEITLVGDIDVPEAASLVASTYGALEKRNPLVPNAGRIPISLPPQSFAETVVFDGPPEVAVLGLTWPVDSVSGPGRHLGEILAAVLTTRLSAKLRSEMGETYSPSAGLAWEEKTDPATVDLRCMIELAPGRINQVLAATRDVAATLARDGVSEDEFERARRPLIREMETNVRENTWWVSTLAQAQSLPATAETEITARADYQNATRDELNALARRVLVPERESHVIAMPKGAAPAAQE